MSLTYQILGRPGRDNALFVRIDTGQSLSRLLFDCGDGCLSELPFSEVLEIDHLLFSHLHMDHIGGFDTFFRCTWNRSSKPNHIWGPPRTVEILHHRFRGFLWNLHDGQEIAWQVHDLDEEGIVSSRFRVDDAFASEEPQGRRPRAGSFLDGPGFTVEALLMDHGTPSVAYIVRETPRINVDTTKLAALGLAPGPWLKRVRGPRAGVEEMVEVGGTPRRVAELQEALVTSTPGDSIAYLTDFLMDEAAADRLEAVLRGVTTVVCESQNRHADLDLARRYRHMTATQAAEVALRAGVGRLVLFHLSDRYRPEEWRTLLEEARAVFPATSFPDYWSI